MKSLPKTLEDTYAQILDNINRANYLYVFKILQWLTHSARPLELGEIAEVVAIDLEQSPRFDLGNRFPDPRDILKICSSLISLEVGTPENIKDDETDSDSDSDSDGKSDYESGNGRVVIRLAHFSVKEYLVSASILQGKVKRYSVREINAHTVIANDCLAYLLHFDAIDTLTFQSFDEFPLIKYAAQHWAEHAEIVERGSGSNSLLTMEFFLSEGNALRNCIRVFDPHEPFLPYHSRRNVDGIYSPLYYASLTGLYQSVQVLLDKGADVNAECGILGNALQAAAVNGSDRMVQILLDNGANVNIQGGYYGNALQAAAWEGHERIVQVLLDNGANVNIKGGNFGNALQAAACVGHERIAQVLFDNGANVDPECEDFGDVLQSARFKATFHQHVHRLLDERGDVNAQGGNVISIHVNEYVRLVQVLLDTVQTLILKVVIVVLLDWM